MSDDFGTINVKRGERSREIEVLRQHYRQHREALARMMADAPTEHLATEYQRLLVEIDRALGKLNELEGGTAAAPPPLPPNPRLKTEPGMRPLVTTANPDDDDGGEPATPHDLPPGDESRSRVPLILAVTLVALVLIGWLVWKASSDRGDAAIVAESTAPTSTAPDTSLEETTTTAAPAASALAISPASHDYGVIRKGTRATRQFEITNNSDEPMSIQVARSTCRCLYYEHAPVIPPKAKETLTITVDGAKAKAGELRESVRITKKNDADVAASVDVRATIQ
jgi:Protein of unknown function (DUF1573)